jgi:hypothetical protein
LALITMTEPAAPEPIPYADGSIFGPGKLTQLLIVLAAGLACAVFWLAARGFHIPREPGFNGSLLQAPATIMGLVLALVLLVICTKLGDWIVGTRWPLGGLFAACVGLAVWAIRGGTMQSVLFRTDSTGGGSGIFLRLVVELIVLYAAIACLWNALWQRQTRRNAIAGAISIAAKGKIDEGRSTGAALLAQCGLTALVVFLVLVETSVKKQVMVGVFLGGLAGTAVAETFFATRQAWRWYWIGPLIAGLVGYLAAYVQPAGMSFGHLTGALAPLARALPLDYASLGCAGAIAGHWLSAPEAVDAGDDVEDAGGGTPVS